MDGRMDRWMDHFLIPGFLHAVDLWAEWRMAKMLKNSHLSVMGAQWRNNIEGSHLFSLHK